MTNDITVRILAFVGAFCVVVSQSSGDLYDLRVWLAATAGGCSAVLALMRAPGQSAPPATRDERVDAIKQVIREQAKPVTTGGKG